MSFSVTVGITLSDTRSTPEHLVIHFNLCFSLPRRPSTPSSKNTILDRKVEGKQDSHSICFWHSPDSASLVLPCSQVKAILWAQMQGKSKGKRPRLRGICLAWHLLYSRLQGCAMGHDLANGNGDRASLPLAPPKVTHFANVSNNQINNPYPTFKSEEKSSRKDWKWLWAAVDSSFSSHLKPDDNEGRQKKKRLSDRACPSFVYYVTSHITV